MDLLYFYHLHKYFPYDSRLQIETIYFLPTGYGFKTNERLQNEEIQHQTWSHPIEIHLLLEICDENLTYPLPLSICVALLTMSKTKVGNPIF